MEARIKTNVTLFLICESYTHKINLYIYAYIIIYMYTHIQKERGKRGNVIEGRGLSEETLGRWERKSE
jgi:hypothetical protein